MDSEEAGGRFWNPTGMDDFVLCVAGYVSVAAWSMEFTEYSRVYRIALGLLKCNS